MIRGLAGADRALFWTFAIAAFAIAMAGLGARAVDRVAIGYEGLRNNYAIVRIVAPDGPAGIAVAEAALAHAPHVVSAAPMTAHRAEELLQQMGGQGQLAQLPPLGLIEIDLDPNASGDISGDIEAALAQSGVTARVIRAPAGAGGAMALDVRNAAWWGAGLFAAVMALIVSLAARGLAARRVDLVTVLADLGATARETSGRVGDEAAALGLRAGIIGALAAGVAGLVMLVVFVPGLNPRALLHVLGPLDAAPLAIAPVLAALAAGMGARAGAESVHAQAARLA
jgi:hypothetical protein